MSFEKTNLSRAVEYNKSYLIRELEALGYTEDLFGKTTREMTLTELEQIHINLKNKIAE